MRASVDRGLLLVKRVGPRLLIAKAAGRVFGTNVYLGLRCQLTLLPPIRPAKFEVVMKSCDSVTFSGFIDELDRVSGLEYIEVANLQSWCSSGVRTLYVATGPNGTAAYTQWLLTANDELQLRSHQPWRHSILGSNDVLLEGAYTFSRFRRTGVMSNGMAQLLRIAQAGGAHSAITYVAADNIPALRGCANVGFTLDHVIKDIRRLGSRRGVMQPVDGNASRIWAAATAPHSAV